MENVDTAITDTTYRYELKMPGIIISESAENSV